MKFYIYAIILTIPLQDVAISIGNTNHITIFEFIALASLSMSPFFFPKKVYYPKASAFLFLLCIWIFIGAFFTINPFSAIAKVFKIMLNLYVLLLVYNYLLRENSADKLISLIKKVALLESVFSVIEYVFINFIGENVIFHATQAVGEVKRVDGTFNDANYLGLYIACSFIIVFTDILFNKKRGRFDKLLAVFLFAVLLLTLSRSGLLAALAGVAIVLTSYYSSKQQLNRLIKYIIALFPVTLIVLISLMGVYPDFFERYTTMFDLDRGDVYVRIVQYLTAIAMYRDNMLLGVGAGNYMNYIQYYNGYTGGSLIPHNSFLEIAAETGTIALLLMVSFFIYIIKDAWRYRDNEYNVIMLGCVVATLISGFFYSNIYYQMPLFIYLAIGYSRCYQK